MSRRTRVILMLIGQVLVVTGAAVAGRLWLGWDWSQLVYMCATWASSVGLILFMHRPWREES